MDMIERAANAVIALGKSGRDVTAGDVVRAVIREMREPTEAMVEAGIMAPLFGEDYNLEWQISSAWSAMIDTALTDSEGVVDTPDIMS